MPLPSATDVVNKFLYNQDHTPSNLNTDDFTVPSTNRFISVDTAAYFDPMTGPGRFALASKSALVEAFFSGSASNMFNEISIVNSTLPNAVSWLQADGSYRLTKEELAGVLGLDAYGIHVANRSVADGYDDYAERTFIWGGTRAQLSSDVRFVIDPWGGRQIENMAIMNWGNDDFDFIGSDLITNLGNAALEHAIDPSSIGERVELRFTDYDPEGFTYTITDYQADLAKESSWAEKSLDDLYAAMQAVTNDLWTAGVTKFIYDERPVMYGTSDDDALILTNTTAGHNIQHPYHISGPWAMELHLDEYVENGIIYRAGDGSDLVLGTEYDDVIYGDADDDVLRGEVGIDVLIGGSGIDQLFGGAGDDFIFFDAEDTMVNGGSGRDVGWALTGDPIMADLVAMAMEVLIGGGGADTIILSGGTDPLFAAGGAGNDTFVVTHNDIEGPKILWGGAGADTFEFNQTDPEYRWEQVGIAVVHIAALTEEMFATLTLGALGLAGIDLTKIDAIILNPDAGDQFRMDGGLLSTHSINLEEFDITTGPGYHLVDDFDTPASFEVRSSGFLGETQAIQSVFFNEIRFETTYWELYDYYQIGVTASGVVDVMETESFTETGGIANLEEAIALALENSQAWFQENEPYWVQQETSDSPYYAAPFFVVGGRFAGATLIDDGSLVATPEDPGTTAFDWLLAA
jgi:Ca2+-binding RTX toxin-like protein